MQKRALIPATLVLASLTLAACGKTATNNPTPAGGGDAAPKTTKVKVAWCAKTVTSAAAPFLIGKEFGWLKEEGLEIELVPMPGSGDCAQAIHAGNVDMGVPSLEPIAIGREKGMTQKIFYTAYQGNIFQIAVEENSPIKEPKDLKGKKIGVIGLNSSGVVIAKATVKANGLDPEKDITLVNASEAAATAALLKRGEVQALAQFDTNYALVENAGVKVRMLPAGEFDSFPSNGLAATEDWLKKNEKIAIAIGRIYAKGTLFAVTNPEATVKLFWKYKPDAKPVGKAEDVALKEEVHVLQARVANWKLDKGGVKKWGENNPTNYTNYLKYLKAGGQTQSLVKTEDVITNALIDKINEFDAKKVEELAKNWKG